MPKVKMTFVAYTTTDVEVEDSNNITDDEYDDGLEKVRDVIPDWFYEDDDDNSEKNEQVEYNGLTLEEIINKYHIDSDGVWYWIPPSTFCNLPPLRRKVTDPVVINAVYSAYHAYLTQHLKP